MHVHQFPPPPARIALLYGSIAGVILGLLQSVILFASQPLMTSNGSPAPGQPGLEFLFLVSPLLWVIGFLIIGTLSAKRTGATSTGTLSGLFAGLFGGIITAIAQIAVSTFGRSLFPTDGADLMTTLFAETILSFYIVAFAVGGGAGFGVLGGLIGHTISSVQYVPPMPFNRVPYPMPLVPPGPAVNMPFPTRQVLPVTPAHPGNPPFPTAQTSSMPVSSTPPSVPQARQASAAEIVYSPPTPQPQE